MEAVRAYRQRKGWTQVKLAAETGVAQPYISMIETGAQRCSHRTLEKLAAGLGVPVWQLYLAEEQIQHMREAEQAVDKYAGVAG